MLFNLTNTGDIVGLLHFLEQQISLLKEELMKTRETCPAAPVYVSKIKGEFKLTMIQVGPILLI